MDYKNIAVTTTKKIALVAHDNKKQDLFAWAKYNRNLLERHKLYATGTTGRILAEELELKIVRLESGQLGGDQQSGARSAEGQVGSVTCVWDALEPLRHDPDSKALWRVAMVWNIAVPVIGVRPIL